MNTRRIFGLCSLLIAMACLTVVSYAGLGTGQVRAAPARDAATSTVGSVSVVAAATGTPSATATASSVSVVPVATATATTGSVSVVPVTVTAATATPVTVATNTPLAAEPVLAMHVVAFQHGKVLTFRWKMVMQSGITGYRLFARSHALTRVIQPHRTSMYRESLHWKGDGPFFLKILTRFGKPMRIRAGR